MHTFFHGWRRKAGVVTLVMAGLVMIAWLRSRVVEDKVAIKTSKTCQHSIRLADSGLWWVSSEYSNLELLDSQMLSWNANPTNWRTERFGQQFIFGRLNPSSHFDHTFQEMPVEVHWRWRFCGGDFGNITRHSSGMLPRSTPQKVWFVPFWWFVLPLTLLSAYLLFSKPRKRVTKAVDSLS